MIRSRQLPNDVQLNWITQIEAGGAPAGARESYVPACKQRKKAYGANGWRLSWQAFVASGWRLSWLAFVVSGWRLSRLASVTSVSKLLLLPVLLLLHSCNSADVFNEYHPVANEGWNRDSLAEFSPAITDSVSPFSLFLHLRHTGRFALRDVWTAIEAYAPDSNLLWIDTVRIQLADNRGDWLGAGSGQLLDREMPYERSLRFAPPGTYRFVLRHCMTDTVLPGITHVGLRISYQNGKK